MKTTILSLLAAVVWMNATAQTDTKNYQTYIKNGQPVYYCTNDGLTVVVDATTYGKWDLTLAIINKTGREVLFEPEKIKARCYTISGTQSPEVKHSWKIITKAKLDTATIKKDELKIFPYHKGRSERNFGYWAGEYGGDLYTIWKQLKSINEALSNNCYATWVLPYDNGENEKLRKLNMGQWRTNTLPDYSESEGYILIDGTKADHLLLEIPIDGETYRFLIYQE